MSESAPTLPPESWAGADLQGRQILVVGASGGLGRSCALAAAARGANVILLGRRVAALERIYDEIERAGHPQPAIYPMNLEAATPAEFADLAQRLIDGCGRIDGMVYAANRLHGLTPIEHYEPEEWLRTLQIGLTVPFLLLQALLPAWRHSDDPCAIFIADEATRANSAYWGAYGVAQAGLRALLAMAAAEFTSERLRLLALQPAPMATALRRAVHVSEAREALADPAAYAPLLCWLLARAPKAWSGQVLDASTPR